MLLTSQKSAMQRVMPEGAADGVTYDDLRTELCGFAASLTSPERVEVSVPC